MGEESLNVRVFFLLDELVLMKGLELNNRVTAALGADHAY